MGESPAEDQALPFSPVEAVAGAEAALRQRFADAGSSLPAVSPASLREAAGRPNDAGWADASDPGLTALPRRVAA